MILCGADGKVCDKQQYCPSKRMYEVTAGAGNCARKEGRMESRKG